MYRISPFTPIFFAPSGDKHGAKPPCVQVFSQTDRILIEVIATQDDLPPFGYLLVREAQTGNETKCWWKQWNMNASTILYFVEMQGLDEGIYVASIGPIKSEPFIVTSNESILQDTVLLQYSNRDNRQRNDAVFWIDGMQRFFDFRIPGGFKDDNWTFSVNNEQFVTSENDRIDLFGHESTIKALTIGNSEGCPVWFAELVNRLLCCNYVYVDKVRYVRNEGEVPEMNAEVEGLKSYIFRQGLQKVENLDPDLESNNLLVMRRVGINDYRANTIDEEIINLIL